MTPDEPAEIAAMRMMPEHESWCDSLRVDFYGGPGDKGRCNCPVSSTPDNGDGTDRAEQVAVSAMDMIDKLSALVRRYGDVFVTNEDGELIKEVRYDVIDEEPVIVIQ